MLSARLCAESGQRARQPQRPGSKEPACAMRAPAWQLRTGRRLGAGRAGLLPLGDPAHAETPCLPRSGFVGKCSQKREESMQSFQGGRMFSESAQPGPREQGAGCEARPGPHVQEQRVQLGSCSLTGTLDGPNLLSEPQPGSLENGGLPLLPSGPWAPKPGTPSSSVTPVNSSAVARIPLG